MRYKRVGLPEEMVEPNFNISFVRKYDSINGSNGDPSQLSTRLTTASLIATQFYLSEDATQARFWANSTLQFAQDYFRGGWRDLAPSGNYGDQPPDRNWQNRNRSWKNQWQAGVLWGSVLGEWSLLAEIAQALPNDIELNIEQSQANRSWLLILARVVQGRSLSELTHFVNEVWNSKRKREPLLLKFLEAVLLGNDDQILEASKTYFNSYKKTDAKQLNLTLKISCEGSFIVHLGRHLGRNVPLPKGSDDFVVCL